MKKIIVLIVFLLGILFYAFSASFTQIGTNLSDGYVFSDKKIQENLYAEKDEAVKASEVFGGEGIYKRLTSVYYGDENKVKINADFPIYVNDGQAVTLINGAESLVNDKYDTFSSFQYATLNDGYLFDIGYERADYETYLFAHLANGLYVNSFEIKVKTFLNEYTIPENSIIFFSTDSIRFYAYDKGVFKYGSVQDIEDISVLKFNDDEITYKELLLKLGEVIEYHDIQNDEAGQIKRENNKAKAEALANAQQGKTSKQSTNSSKSKNGSGNKVAGSKVAKKNVAVGAAEKADRPEEAKPLPSKKEKEVETPVIQNWVKPSVKVSGEYKAGVYTLLTKLDISDPANVIVNGLTFEVYINDGEDKDQNYKRQSFPNTTGTDLNFLITYLEPNRSYYIKAYYKYYNEYRQIQDAVYFIEKYEFKTKKVTDLEPITLNLEKNPNLNFETVSISSIQIKDTGAYDTIGSISRVNIRVYKDTVNYNGINLSTSDIEKLTSMQSISYTSSKGLQSNHDYSIKILCYDRFNNELEVKNNIVDTRTCMKMPIGKIATSYLTDDYGNKIITSVGLTPTITNDDGVEYDKLYFKITKEDLTYLYVNGKKEIPAVPSEASVLTGLEPGMSYTVTLYCIADNLDGKGKIERAIASKNFTTSEIGQLGSLYLTGIDLTGRTYPDEMHERVYYSLQLNRSKTNSQLPKFVSYLNIVLKEKEGSSVSITLTKEQLAQLLNNEIVYIDSNDFAPDGLSSFTNYSIAYEAGYIDDATKKVTKIPVSCSFNSFKTARKPVAILMTTPEAMTGYIASDILISDIDDYVKDSYIILNIYEVVGDTTKMVATFQIDKNTVNPYQLRMFNDATMSSDGKSYEIKGDTCYRMVFVGEEVNSLTGDDSNEILQSVDVTTNVGVEGNVSLKSLTTKPDTVKRDIPEGYTQVEYIQINNDASNGYANQILTDIAWKNIAAIESKICITKKASSHNIFFNVNGGGAPYISYMDSAIYSYYTGYTVTCTNNYGRNKMMERMVEQRITVTSSMNQNSSSKMAVGAYSNSSSYSGSYRVGYLKVYDKNDSLLGDFVPCVRDYDQQAGFYDLVNNKFYGKSRGTGTITHGAKITDDDFLIEEGKYRAIFNVDIDDETEWLSNKTYYVDLFDMNKSSTEPIQHFTGVYEGTGTNGIPREFTTLVDDDGMKNHNYLLQLYILTMDGTKIPLSTATFNADERINTISNLAEFLAVQGLDEKYVVINDIIFEENPYEVNNNYYYYNGPWGQSNFNARIDFQGYKLSYFGNGPLLYVMTANSSITNCVFETKAMYSRRNTSNFSRGSGDIDRGSGALVWNNRGTISNIKITYRQDKIGSYRYTYYWQDIDGYDMFGNYNPRYPYFYSANVIVTNNGLLENFVVDVPEEIYASSYCGVVGENYTGTIRNGYVYSSNPNVNYRVQLNVADNSNDSYYRGILCGRNYATGLIENVYVLGDIKCDLSANAYYYTGIVCGYNYGITRNTYSVGNVTKGDTVLKASSGPTIGGNSGNTRYVKNNNYISEYTYDNTFNTKTSAVALKSVSWQNSVLNADGGENFEVESLVNSGCYPHIKYSTDYMPVQEYIFLPTMKLGDVDVLFSQLYKLGNDRAIDQELGAFITGDELRLTSETDPNTGITYYSDVQLIQVYISDKTASLVYGLKFSDTRLVAKCVKQVNDGKGVSLCYMIVYNPTTAVNQYKITDIIFQDIKGDAGTTMSVAKQSRYITCPYFRQISNVSGNDSWEYLTKNATQNYRLYNDLDFSGKSFKDIQVKSTFQGQLDGNNHTISNINFESNPLKSFYTDYWDVSRNGGLFNYISGADIYDLTIENFNCEGGYCCGALAGRAVNSYISNVYANDIYVCAVCNVGGLVGRADSSNEFISCGINRAKIVLAGGENTSYTENCAGGLCGYVNLNNKFTRVYASDIYIEDISSSARYIFSGGLFGYTYDVGTEIKGAYATGTIVTSAQSSGGVIGCCYSMILVENVYTDVDIYTYSSQAAGTIGWTRELINGNTILSFGDIILMSEATNTKQTNGLFMDEAQSNYVNAMFCKEAKLITDSSGESHADLSGDNCFDLDLIAKKELYNYLSESYFVLDTDAANGILPKLIDETKTPLPYQTNNIAGYSGNYFHANFKEASDFSEGYLTVRLTGENAFVTDKSIEILALYYDFTYVDESLEIPEEALNTYSRNETIVDAQSLGRFSNSTSRTQTTSAYKMEDAELNCAYDRYFITSIKYKDKNDDSIHYLRVNEVIETIDTKQFKNINSIQDYKTKLTGSVAENFYLNCDIDFEDNELNYYSQTYANTVINRLVGTRGSHHDYLSDDLYYKIANAKMTMSNVNTEKFGFLLNGDVGIIRRTLSELSNIEFNNIQINRRRTSGVVGGVNGKVSGVVFKNCNVENNTYYGYGEGLMGGGTADCIGINVENCKVINKGAPQGSLLFATYLHNYRLGSLQNINISNSALTSTSSYNGLIGGYWYGYFNFYTSTTNPSVIDNITIDTCSSAGSSYSSLLFGYTYNTYAKIRNVNFKDSSVKGSSYVGAVLGYMYNPGFYIGNVYCENCISKGTGSYIGMVGGQGYNGYYLNVDNCKVYGKDTYVGGVYGHYNGDSYVSSEYKNSAYNEKTPEGNSYYYAVINNSYVYGHQYVGGLGGYNGSSTYNGVVSNCEIRGNYYVGGICGLEAYTPVNCVVRQSIITSYADEDEASIKGIIYKTNPHGFGGISGYYCRMDNCLVENCLIGSNKTDFVGGFGGYNNDYSSSQTSTNSVCQDCIVVGKNYVGGMFGSLGIGSTNYVSYLNNSASNAYVVGKDYVGGIAGRVTGYYQLNKAQVGEFITMPRTENVYFTGTLYSENRAGAVYGTILGNTEKTFYLFRYVSSLPDYIRAKSIVPVFCENENTEYGYSWSKLLSDTSPTFISLWADTKIFMSDDSTITTMKELIQSDPEYSAYVDTAANVAANFSKNIAGDPFIVLYDSEVVNSVTMTSSEVIDKYFYNRSLLSTRSTVFNASYNYYGFTDKNFTDYMPMVVVGSTTKNLNRIIWSKGDGTFSKATFITKTSPITGENHVYELQQGLAVPGSDLYYQKLSEMESVYATYMVGGTSAIGWGVDVASVPESYTVLEYLKSSGSQYILLNYYNKTNTWVDTELSFNAIYSYNTVYGSASSDNSSDSMSFGIYSGGFNCDFGKLVQVKWPNLTANTKYHVIFNPKNAIVDGTQYSFNGNYTSNNFKVEVFGRNFKNTTYTNEIGQCAYYSLKIYEGTLNDSTNSVLKLDLVPVRENTTGELGMYDRVSKVFYKNNGTGSFIAGSDTSTIIQTDEEFDYSQYVTAYASGIDTLNIEFRDLYLDELGTNPYIKIYAEGSETNPIVNGVLDQPVYSLKYDYLSNLVVEFGDDENDYSTGFKAADLRNNIMLSGSDAYTLYNGSLYDTAKHSLASNVINIYGGKVMMSNGTIYSVNNLSVVEDVFSSNKLLINAVSLYDFTYAKQNDTVTIHTYGTRSVVVTNNANPTSMSSYRLFVKNGNLISIKQGKATANDPLYVKYSGGDSEILIQIGSKIMSIGTKDPISLFTTFVSSNVKKISSNLGNINANNNYLLVEYLNNSIVLYDMNTHQMVNTYGNLNGGNLLTYLSNAMGNMFEMGDTSYNVTGQSSAASQIASYLSKYGMTLSGLISETDVEDIDELVLEITTGESTDAGNNNSSSIGNLTISTDDPNLKGDDLTSNENNEEEVKEQPIDLVVSKEEKLKIPNVEAIVEKINEQAKETNEEIVVTSNKDKDNFISVYDPEKNEFEIYNENEFFKNDEPTSEDSRLADKTTLNELYRSLGENEDETTTRGIVIYLIIAVAIICLLIPLWVLRKKSAK